MAFWDNLSKKASEAADKAAQQVKVLSETTKLNSAVSDEEKKISVNYSEIGKLYVSLHKDDCEEAFAEMIAAIVESEAKIAEYKEQIKVIKGVQVCEKCLAEMPRGTAFCSACGAPMPKVEEEIVDTTAEEVEEAPVAEEPVENTEG